MMYARLMSGCALAVSLGALPGCRVGLDDLQPSLQATLQQMEARIGALESAPQLGFAVHDTHISIEEKTFTPLLIARASLDVQGDPLPPAFYVDVLLTVRIDGVEYEAAERQIFPVINGKCQLEMQHSLPQHGLKNEEVQVSLRPMTWYSGQAISDTMVIYQ